MRRSILILAALPAALGAAGMPLFEAVRNGELTQIRALLKSGVDPNQRNEFGATPLMCAAAFSSTESMRALLDGGAEVNASGNNGATALMWATGEAAKVRLLLERGAAVSAETKDGTTALVTAARRGNREVERLLIAHGADPKGPASDGATGPIPVLLLANVTKVRQFLDAGANPNQTVTFVTGNVPIFALAAAGSHLETMRLLIERGADPNLKVMRNRTPLMMAAAASPPDPAVVRFLLETGADLQARDDMGRTALDWALTQGETEVARLLREAGLKPIALAALPGPVAKPRNAREAVGKALARLEPIGPIFFERTKCISCHNQSLPQIAMKVAGAHGIAVSGAAAAHPAQATFQEWRSQIDEVLLGRCRGGFVSSVIYGLLGLSEEGVPSGFLTDAATSCLVTLQQPDGGWRVVAGGIRPPLDGRPMVSTALAIRGLDVYGPPGRRDEMKARIVRAREFLLTAAPGDTQDEAFRLLGFIWAGSPVPQVSGQVERLLALQRENGGWGQLPTMDADAYGTGQALYALRAGGLSPASAAYKKGAEYLLRTQLEDGSWRVRSRAFGFQPYFESGFPHGGDQFISAAATSWAAIALAYTL